MSPTRVRLGQKKGAPCASGRSLEDVARPPRQLALGALTACSVHGRYRAAVLRVGLFARAGNGGALLAVADRRNAGSRNARRNQDVLRRLGAPLAEREIVLARAALVAMALDRDCNVRIAPQPIGLSRQGFLRFRCDVGPVEREEHAVAGTRFQILLRSWYSTPRTNPPGAARPWSARPARRRLRRAAAGSQQQHQPTKDGRYFHVHPIIPLMLQTHPRLCGCITK